MTQEASSAFKTAAISVPSADHVCTVSDSVSRRGLKRLDTVNILETCQIPCCKEGITHELQFLRPSWAISPVYFVYEVRRRSFDIPRLSHANFTLNRSSRNLWPIPALAIERRHGQFESLDWASNL